MITEDYVNFEIAKLLKEKGFDEKCGPYYDLRGVLINGVIIEAKHNVDMDKFSAPTLQMAMKWLREVHNIHIEIGYNLGYFPVCISTKTNDTIPYIAMGSPFTYEQACEVAIKYCLEHLI